MKDPSNTEPYTNLIRLITILTTIFALICLIRRHQYKSLWKRTYFSKDKETRIYYRYSEVLIDQTKLYIPEHTKMLNEHFYIEFVCMCFCPIPWIDFYIQHTAAKGKVIYYFFSEIMLALMVFRLIFIIRSVFNYMIYTDCYSKRICQTYGFNNGLVFAYKCQMTNNTARTVIYTCLIVTFSFAWLLRIVELPFFRTETSADSINLFDSYFNSIWCVVITMTTVGYGDTVPATCPGKCLAMMIALTGSFLTSIVIVTVTNTLQLPTKQTLAMRHIHITRSAALTVQKAFKFFRAKKRYFMLKDLVCQDEYVEAKGKNKLIDRCFSNFLIQLKKN